MRNLACVVCASARVVGMKIIIDEGCANAFVYDTETKIFSESWHPFDEWNSDDLVEYVENNDKRHPHSDAVGRAHACYAYCMGWVTVEHR